MNVPDLNKIKNSDPVNTILDLTILAAHANMTLRRARRGEDGEAVEGLKAIYIGTLMALAIAVNGIERYSDLNDLTTMVRDGERIVEGMAEQAANYVHGMN